ncbi:zinc finger protein 862-like, partial [Aphis craccivora]
MSDSDCGFSSSEEATQLKRKNLSPNLGTKRKFVHKFRNEWLTKTEFQLWLAKSLKGDTYFSCTVCKKDYHGGISAVKKHAKAESHLSIANSRKNIIPINKNPVFHKASQLQTKSKEAEIRLSMFIIEHNIAIQTSDHLIPLFKSICPESDVVKNISCNRTKATAIVCNVIGKHGSANLIERMKTNIFSIMIDESTDKSSVKHLAIVTRIVDSLSYDVKDEFAALIKVPKASAKDIFDAIVNFFNEMNVPYKKNLVGFASDGANVMFGKHHSVKSLLEKEVPQIFVIKCLCHSLALCASYACEKIPIGVEELIREIYTYMKYSYKRQANYKEFQCFVEVKPHKLLQPSQTRWLALLACVKRTDQIYVGARCIADLSKEILTATEKKIFLTNCLNFFVEAAHQFYKRFPFNSNYVKLLKAMNFLEPNNIPSIVSIAPVAAQFQERLSIDLNDLDIEWRLLRNTDIDNYNKEIIPFWEAINKIEKGDGCKLFPLLSNFVKMILTLPHSSAATERIFSTINLNKTKTRNRLETDTLTGILNAKNILIN